MADIETTKTDQLATGSEADSLEGTTATAEPYTTTASAPPEPTLPAPPERKANRWRRLVSHVNIYALLFILVLVIAVTIVVASYLYNRHNSGISSISSQTLSQSTFTQLANSDATVGTSSQVLNIQSSAIFAGSVLLRQGLEVAGNLQIGGTLSLNNLAVAGTSQFGQAQINKNLSVAGDTGLQGSLTVAQSLQVNGNGSFSGALAAPQVTTSSLQLNGDLVLTHHIIAGGATPAQTNGSALGSGGTSSVSGSDTGGSITINTGGSPAAGCFVTINFTSKYSSTPHVLVSPVGASSGGLDYYVNRSTTSFSVCDNSTPPADTSFGFDYFVVD